MVKIFAVPSHQSKERTSGVDFARVIQPMNYLNTCDGFRVDIYDIHAKIQPNWVQVAKKYDAVFLNYTVLDWAFAAMGAPMRGMGKKIILDLDDAVWYVRSDNPTYQQFNADNGAFTWNIRCMLDEVDLVTTTSGYLRNVIVDKTYRTQNDIKVIPNYIDLTCYNRKYDAKNSHTIKIVHCGSTTHFEDLIQKPFMNAMDKIMGDYPNVEFVTIGSFLSEYRYKYGGRYINEFGDIDIYKWIPKFLAYMETADIVVAPLEIDKYNRAKSYIKYLEYSSTKRPGVYQNIYPYQQIVEHGENGYLAETKEEWYNALKALVDDVALRQYIGDQAYKTTKTHQIQHHVNEYAEAIKQVLDK